MRYLYIILLGTILPFASCKKETKEEETKPVNYKVKSADGVTTFEYDANGLLTQSQLTFAEVTTRNFSWNPGSLKLSVTEGRNTKTGSYARNAAGFVLSGPQDSTSWSYDSENHITSVIDKSIGAVTIKTYTWLNGNMIQETLTINGTPSGYVDYEYSSEKDTRDLGLHYFPWAQLYWHQSIVSGSKNLLSKATYGNGSEVRYVSTFTYVKDGKGRITEQTETVKQKDGSLSSYKHPYTYFD